MAVIKALKIQTRWRLCALTTMKSGLFPSSPYVAFVTPSFTQMMPRPISPITNVLPLGLTISFLVVATNVWADAPLRGNPMDALPPSTTEPAPPSRPAPSIQLPAVPNAAQAAILQRLQQVITPRHFDVSGSHSIPFEEIVAIIEPLANQPITLADLVNHTNRITTLYQESGFPLSFAVLPEQDFANGLVKITVIEGHVRSLRIEGDPGRSEARIRRLSDKLLNERPLTRKTLERTLNLLRTIPGLQITPSLDMPRTTDGGTELVLAVQHSTIGGGVSISDLGTGRQAIAELAIKSATPLGEELRISAAIPTESDDVRYFAGRASVPIGNNGLSFDVDGYHYRSTPDDSLLTQLGWERRVTNERVNVGLSYPLIAENQRNLKASVSLGASRSIDEYHNRLNQAYLVQVTDLRVLSGELQYRSASSKQSRSAQLAVHKGLDSLGAKQRLDSAFDPNARLNTRLDFWRTTLNARQNFNLSDNVGLSLHASGQYSPHILPSTEQVSYGAWRHGFGYPAGEAAGDKGIGLTAELNTRFSLNNAIINHIQPYAAIDWARAWYNDSNLRAYNDRKLSSAAVGLRIGNPKHFIFDVNVAKPIGDLPLNTTKRKYRVNANVLFSYQ